MGIWSESTIKDNEPRDQYTASGGQTAFPYTFIIFDEDDLTVERTRDGTTTTLTRTTDYTVDSVGEEDGGDVTLTSGANADDTITIYRDLPVRRLTDFVVPGDYNPDTLNEELDKVIAMLQEKEITLGRTIRLAVEDERDGDDFELPLEDVRANNLLGFDENGDIKLTLSQQSISEISSIEAFTSGNRPTADGGKILGIETDTGRVIYDNGSWVEVGLSEDQIDLENLGSLDAGDQKITGVSDPTDAKDVVNRQTLHALVEGLTPKPAARAATDGTNIDLTSASDPNPIDGVTLADGDDVLLKDQTDGTENGLYNAPDASDPTTWTRTEEMDEDSEVTGGEHVFITEGTANADKGFYVTSDNPTLGSDDIVWEQFMALGQVTAGDGLTKTGDTLSINLSDFESDISHDGIDQSTVTSDDHHSQSHGNSDHTDIDQSLQTTDQPSFEAMNFTKQGIVYGFESNGNFMEAYDVSDFTDLFDAVNQAMTDGAFLIQLPPGDYNVSTTLSMQARVRVRGISLRKPTVDYTGTGNAIEIGESVDWVELDHFDLRRTATTGTDVNAIQFLGGTSDTNEVSIHDMFIGFGNGFHTLIGDDPSNVSPFNVLIENCVFQAVQESGNPVQVELPTINNNLVVRRCRFNAIRDNAGTRGLGLAARGPNTRIDNCIFNGSDNTQDIAGIQMSSGPFTISDCHFESGNGEAIILGEDIVNESNAKWRDGSIQDNYFLDWDRPLKLAQDGFDADTRVHWFGNRLVTVANNADFGNQSTGRIIVDKDPGVDNDTNNLLSFAQGFGAARLQLSGDQSVASGSETKITFDSTVKDKCDGITVDSTNNTFDVDEAGIYTVMVTVSMASDTGWSDGDEISPRIYKNTTNELHIFGRKVGTGRQGFSVFSTIEASSGDTFEARIRQDSGTSQTVESTNNLTKFEIQRIG